MFIYMCINKNKYYRKYYFSCIYANFFYYINGNYNLFIYISDVYMERNKYKAINLSLFLPRQTRK